MRVSASTLAGRLVVPVVILVLVAVAANVGFMAWWEMRQESLAVQQRREQVADTLAQSRVAVSAPILAALHRLTGDHYVVWNTVTKTPGVATLPMDAAEGALLEQGVAAGAVMLDAIQYRVGSVRAGGVRPETVLVLSPRESVARATWSRVWPILAVAAATLAVLVPLGLRMTSRIATRLGDIDRQVARIAAGDFGSVLGERPRGDEPDEIARLVSGVNRMSQTLAGQRDSLLAGERQRLLGQMAAGFAHEVRNAVTGARLAVDLHRKRCHQDRDKESGKDDTSLDVAIRQLDVLEEEVRGLLMLGRPEEAAVTGARLAVDLHRKRCHQDRDAGPGKDDTSLDVAIRQLDVLEEEVRGLLMLGRPEEAAVTTFSAAGLLQDVCDLVGPRCSHAGTQILHQADADLTVAGRREAVRSALLNLTLNGIDAAGVAGSVYLWAAQEGGVVRLGVDDTGPGPPPVIREAMLEPFVTGKPEGIGLGLAVARLVAESHGGRLEWSRQGNSTRFVLSLPALSALASSSSSDQAPA